MLVQALVSEPAVEALDEGVLNGLARLDEVQPHAPLVGPLVQHQAGELRSIVQHDLLRRLAALGDQLVEHLRHPRPWKRRVYLDRQRLASEGVAIPSHRRWTAIRRDSWIPSTALFMGKQLVEGGLADCVLALGFEKMQKGSLGATFTDRINPMDQHVNTMVQLRGFEPHPPAAQLFGNAGREHMEKYGSTPLHFAKIGYKNHKHSVNNPYSQFQDEYSIEDILAAPMVHEPLTKLQCCPTSDGSGAAVLASEDFVKKHNLQDKAIEILAQTMVTDTADTFDSKSSIKLIGSETTRLAANRVYAQTGLGPEDVDVIELHDCFSANEMITYEALGLADEGTAHKLVEEDAFTYGGQVVVNPSGGLIS